MNLTNLKALAEAAIGANEAHYWQKDWQNYTKEANPRTILELIVLVEQMGEALEKDADILWLDSTKKKAIIAYRKAKDE